VQQIAYEIIQIRQENTMSSIGSIGSNSSMNMQGMHGMKRQDPAKMAEKLFSKLDTAGQGYIQKADLQAAFDKVGASTSSTSGSTTSSSIDDLFSSLDTNNDGKVTKQEFSDTLKQVSDQLDNQYMSMRMNGGMQGQGMDGNRPPPPPPPGSKADSGFTKDELSSQLKEIGSSDSQRSNMISDIVENFDAADTDSNGKVSFQEAMAYEQANASTKSSTTSATTSANAASLTTAATSSTASSTSNSTESTNAKVLQQIIDLMQAYNIGGNPDNGRVSRLSVSA
jgi:Ca2+-binding EF-hand superfamily protein